MQKEEYQILIKDIKALLQDICKDDRVKYHIEPVVKSAKNLALKFNADVQVVEIASYLHDVTKITGDRKKHHITGAKYAEVFLSKYNIEEWKVESIKNCIKKHRGLSEYTRDTIEEFVNINGIPLNLIDTAGIRNTTNEVEQIGVKKSKKIAQDADLIIAIFDATKDLSKEDMEILDIIKDKKIIIVLNKIDLPCKIDENNEYLKSITNNIVKISALNNIGIEEIYNKITKMFNLNEINLDNEIVITNLRHKNLIHKAMENVEKAKQSLNENMPSDIVAIFIKDILESLGEITGEEVTENIINEIFSRFCLGK